MPPPPSAPYNSAARDSHTAVLYSAVRRHTLRESGPAALVAGSLAATVRFASSGVAVVVGIGRFARFGVVIEPFDRVVVGRVRCRFGLCRLLRVVRCQRGMGVVGRAWRRWFVGFEGGCRPL